MKIPNLLRKTNRCDSENIEKYLFYIFLFSGMTGLIYQVAWQRLLTLHYGVENISITIIVSVFMFGLGLGALVGGRYIDKVKNRLKIYFIIELLIGTFGFLSIPILESIGTATAGASYHFVFLYAFLFLSIPTFLMGTTLPILCRIFSEINPDFLRNISFLYFINTLGAAIGTIFCAYILISFWGIDTAIYFAAFLNFLLAIGIFVIIRTYKISFQVEKEEKIPLDSKIRITLHTGYLIIFITGFLAMGYEIIWFRLLSTIMKASPYLFASTLFIYLLGIAVGSYCMHKIITKNKNLQNKSIFFLFQFLIAVFVLFSILVFYFGTQYTPLGNLTHLSFSRTLHPAFIFSFNPYAIYQNLDVFFWAVLFLFVPTLLMGASFPLINSLAYKGQNKTGSTVGSLYFFNIAGNVFGALITGFLLLPYLKTTGTLLLFVIMGLFFLLFVKTKAFTKISYDKYNSNLNLLKYFKILLFLFLICFGILCFPNNNEFYSTIHFPGDDAMVYIEEGVDGVIVTFEYPDKIINYINGLGHGGRPGYGFYREAIVQISHARDTRDILIIGFGTGSIVETTLKLENVDSITVVELSESLIKNLKKINETNEILNDKELDIVIDDGRRYLHTTDKKFDIILMDPLRTTTAYSNNIYSKEFFSLVKKHLKKGGVYGLYNDYEYTILPNTLLQEFRHVEVYSYFMIASDDTLIKNESMYEQLLNSFERDYNKECKAAIVELNVTLIGNETTLREVLKNEKVNTDYRPWLEYRLGEMVQRLVDKN